MGLFSKKEPCPVCGGDVKGLFLEKIANKQPLCKKCSSLISMNGELQEIATPEQVREHLAYREKNAQRFAAIEWDMEYSGIPGLDVGVNLGEKVIYVRNGEMNDLDNPVIFDFDQIIDYKLYRMKKLVDSADMDGGTSLDTGLSMLSSVAALVDDDDSSNNDYFVLKLTTTDPYWPDLGLRISFSTDELHEFLGFDDEMETVCQMFKHIVRGEPVSLF